MKKTIYLLLIALLTSGMSGCSTEQHHISEYDILSVGNFHNGLAKFIAKIPPESVDTKYFEDDWAQKDFLAYYSERNFTLCGYCDINGNVVLEPIYDDFSPDFTEDVMRLERWNGWKQGYTVEYTTKNGKIILTDTEDDNIYDSGDVANGLFWVEIEENDESELIYYNLKGKKEFSFNNSHALDTLSTFSTPENYFYRNTKSNYAVIDKNGTDVIIDTQGNAIDLKLIGMESLNIDQPYDSFIPGKLFGNQMIEFSLYDTEMNREFGEFNGIIDFQKKTLTVNENDEIFSYGYTSKIFDEQQNLVLDLKEIDEFSEFEKFMWVISDEGLVSVRADLYYYSIIDLKGNVLCAPSDELNFTDEYTLFTPSSGLCAAKSEWTELYGYIKTDGTWVIPPIYSSATNFSEGYAIVNDTTVIDPTGKAILIADEDNYLSLEDIEEKMSEYAELFELFGF